MSEGRGAPEHVAQLHPHGDLDALDAVHDEHPQPPVEVDDRLGVVQPRACSVASEHASARPALVVDVRNGLAERVQVAGQSVVAHRFEDRGRVVALAHINTPARKPIDLLLKGQPGLRVLNHEGPAQKKISPRLAATG